MKKIKMIGLDLDGTLLNDKKELTRDPGSAPEFPGDEVRTDIERRKDPGFTGRQSTLCQYALL